MNRHNDKNLWENIFQILISIIQNTSSSKSDNDSCKYLCSKLDVFHLKTFLTEYAITFNKARQHTSPHQTSVKFSESTVLYIIELLVNSCRKNEISGMFALVFMCPLEQSVTDINITTFYQLFGVKAFQYFQTVYQNILRDKQNTPERKKNGNKTAHAA